MRKNISRRDFLKLGGLGAAGLSALALNPRSAFDTSSRDRKKGTTEIVCLAIMPMISD